MPSKLTWITMLFAAIVMTGCSHQFQCHLSGQQCGNGQEQTSGASASAEIGESCESASCTAGSYCAQATQKCTEVKPNGAPCENSFECSGHCAQTPDDPAPVCQ
jgi:hypothetical protein